MSKIIIEKITIFFWFQKFGEKFGDNLLRTATPWGEWDLLSILEGKLMIVFGFYLLTLQFKMQPEAEALKERGNIEYKAKRYKKAIELYTSAIECDKTACILFGNRYSLDMVTEQVMV